MAPRRTADQASRPHPFYIAHATVTATERLSPTFLRVTFGGEELRGFGNPGQTLDQRIKLIFPGSLGLAPLTSESTFTDWQALPEERRGFMRTFSIRDLTVDEDGETTVDVDFALHEGDTNGPAATWAAQAQVGDDLLLFGPRRGRLDGGGIEYCPDDAQRILLVGDETAAPAIARILEESAGTTAAMTAFVEVPDEADRIPVRTAPHHELRWITRGDSPSGSAIVPVVLERLGLPSNDLRITASGSDKTVPWETPWYTNLEDVQAAPKEDTADPSYFWIAGESRLVTTLRRHLVRDLGVGRDQVAFMGYWRRGVAMRG